MPKGSSNMITHPKKTNPQQNEWHEHLRLVHFSLSGSLELLVNTQLVLIIGLPVLLTATLISISRIQLRGRRTCHKDPDWLTLRPLQRVWRNAPFAIAVNTRYFSLHYSIFWASQKCFFFLILAGSFRPVIFLNVDVFAATGMILPYIHPMPSNNLFISKTCTVNVSFLLPWRGIISRIYRK